jgi:site-specific DNA recombinase
MAYHDFHPPLKARDGRTLRVLAVVRISTEHQDEKSLDDQFELTKERVTLSFDGAIEWSLIRSRGSGEVLEREELTDLYAKIQSGRYDLVICEDLGRICRRVHAYVVCELCEDSDTRLIALNDSVDTARSDWQTNAFFSVVRHEQYNKDTAARIRRTQRNRFMHGGMTHYRIFGYTAPPGAKLDQEIQIDLQLLPYALGMIERLEAGQSFQQVADWLNQNGVRPGPRARRQTWSHRLVSQWIYNTQIKGERQWNNRISVRVNKTGRRKKVKAPARELLTRQVPHWAIVDAERYDALVRMLKARNSRYGSAKRNGVDPRLNRPRKRTRWPGQHATCGICGAPFVYGGHGRTEYLMCNGTRGYNCWNGVTFHGELAAKNISAKVLAAIEQLPEFDQVLLETIEEEAAKFDTDRLSKINVVEKRIAETERQIANVSKAIAEGKQFTSLLAKLEELELSLAHDRDEWRTLTRVPAAITPIPSVAQIRKDAVLAMHDLAVCSQEFAALMRKLVSRVDMYPFIPCDGGHPVLRARVALDLRSFLPEKLRGSGFTDSLRSDLIVDCFEPYKRYSILSDVTELKHKGQRLRDIGQEIGQTFSLVQKASAIDEIMVRRGLKDPYIEIVAPDMLPSRMRRHKHQRYNFKRIDDTA